MERPVKKYDFTAQQVEETFILKSWWAAAVILPAARRVALFVLNYTDASPNLITLVSFSLRILAAWCFVTGNYYLVIVGALLFQIGYIADCVDGPVARLKNKASTFGRYFDHMADLIGGVVALTALAYGQYMLFTPILLAVIYIYMTEYYITYLANIAIERGGSFQEPSVLARNGLVDYFMSYREFFFKRNMKSFFSLPDFEALVFFIFPIFDLAAEGIEVGFYFLILVTLYKILSSFVTVHRGGKLFP